MRRICAAVVIAVLSLAFVPPAGVAAVGDTLTLSPPTDTNTVGEEHCVTAQLAVVQGSRNNVWVRFTVTGANPTTGSAQTNGSGQARFCYTGTRAGVDTITAYADQNNNNTPNAGEPVAAPVTKVYVAAAPNSVTLTPVADENPVGEEHCVTATVTDRFGNPTPNRTVRFTVTGANSRTGVRTTDASGQTQFCYTGTSAGLDTIRAYADTNDNGTQDTGEPVGTATKTYVDQTVGTVTVTPATDTNPVGAQHCVTATTRTLSGTALAGVPVYFRVTGANTASGVATTGANGQAQFCYIGTVAGTDTITATADADKDGTPENGEPTGTATKVYLPAAPNAVAISPATDTNTVGDEHCVTATVTDRFGNRVGAGVSVVFSVAGANPGGGTATTGADGTARFCYTGENAGTDTITAYADTNVSGQHETGEPQGAATKLYVAGAPDRVTLDPGTATNRVGDEHCVTATVTDQFGNPTPGAEVTFVVTGANGTSNTITVAANPEGQAEFCYTGRNAGTDTIRAYVDENDNGAFDADEPTAVATKTYSPGEPAVITLDPVAAVNPVGAEHCVTARVVDEFGNATPGVQVVFTVTGANPTQGVRTTDENGRATFCYTGTRSGEDLITAYADTNGDETRDTGEPAATASSKSYLPGEAATVVVAPATDTNTVGQQHCVTATVTDVFGNPVPGETVFFTVEGANGTTGRDDTDATGLVEFCYTGTVAGTDVITATADTDNSGAPSAIDPSGGATKVYLPGAPATVELDPAAATNVAGEQHCVTATVRDEFGNPVGAGVSVRFTVTGANNAATSLRTDRNGAAVFCYTGTKAGVDAIRAVADRDNDGQFDAGEPVGAAEKTYLPGEANALTLTPLSDTNRVGEQHCVTASAVDAFGNPVPNETVYFTVTGANPRSGSDTTDADGQAQFCYTGRTSGVDAITAYVDNDGDRQQDPDEPTAAAEKTYRPGAPATITLTPATDENTVGEQHCVTATVRDEFGNPVEEGTAVRFEVTGANPRGPVSRTTDALGAAEFCYTGTTVGADAITAYADNDNDNTRDAGEPTAGATKIYQPGAPAAVVLTPPADENRVGDEHCVTATVTDAFGNPTPGITVRFAVAGVNTAAGADQTSATGQATFCYTGKRTGLDSITAYADTDNDRTNGATEPEGAATKLYQPGDPATVVLTPPTDENVAGQQHCVTAQVADQFGNPTPRISVLFSVDGANTAAGADRTDELGQAEFCYTGTRAGLDTITAYADTNGDGTNDEAEPEGVATKLYQPGTPATVEVTPTADENVVGDEHCVVATVRDAFGNVVPNALVEFTVAGANTAIGTATTDDAGRARFCYTGETSGADTIRATADADGDRTAETGEPTGTGAKTYRPGKPASAVLLPPTDTNTAGEEHCVTAVVRDEFGNLVDAGHHVVFAVAGANPHGPAMRATDEDGRATFCYIGTTAGEDVIAAFVDNNRNETFDEGDVVATPASKTYTPGAPAAVTITPAAATNTAGDQHCVTATVVDEFGNRVPGVTVRFAVSGANTAAGADTTDAAGNAAFCYTGTRAGVDAITAYADTDNDNVNDPTEPEGVAEKTYVAAAPAKLTLSPKTATNVVGDEHCVTATVTDAFGNPTSGVEVDFTVAGFNATGGERTTGGDGRAEFCYTGQLPGEDAIRAFADLDKDDVQDAGEPTDGATKTYVVPASTPGCRVTLNDGGWIIAANGDRASFGGNAKALTATKVSGEQTYTDHGPARPMRVKSTELLAVTCTGDRREATLYGLATIDQTMKLVPFRIRLRDSGEPGRGDRYGILVGNGYYSGEQPLQGGNVQIR